MILSELVFFNMFFSEKFTIHVECREFSASSSVQIQALCYQEVMRPTSGMCVFYFNEVWF